MLIIMGSYEFVMERFIRHRMKDSDKTGWEGMTAGKSTRTRPINYAELNLGKKMLVFVDPDTGEITNNETEERAFIPYQGQPLRIVLKGSTGSGKSTTLLYLVSQYIKKLKAKAIVLIDPKDEWQKYRPNNRYSMLSGENPYSFSGLSLRPSFVVKQSGKEISGSKVLTLGFLDLTPEEMMVMARTEPRAGAGTFRALSKAKDVYIEKYGAEKPSLKKFKDVIGIDLPNLEDRTIAPQSYRAALGMIEFLEREQAIGDKTTVDVIESALHDKVVAIHYSMTIQRVFNMASCYCSMILRNIHEWCSKALNEDDPHYGTHILTVIDEAVQIAPRTKEPPSKRALIDTFQVARGIKVSCILACLNLYDMDYGILTQASKIVVIGNVGADDKVLKALNFDPNDIELISRVCRFDNNTGERIGVILDPQNPKDLTFFSPTMPPTLFGHE